jgi:hypothetical protein
MLAITPRQGRPTIRTPEMAAVICDKIAAGKSLYRILETAGMPSYAAVCVWLREDRDFQEQYAHAREAQADFLAEEMIEIADATGNVQRDRLRIDARMWMAGKLRPKKYGIRPDAPTVTESPQGNVMTEERIADLVARKRASIGRGRATQTDDRGDTNRHPIYKLWMVANATG